MTVAQIKNELSTLRGNEDVVNGIEQSLNADIEITEDGNVWNSTNGHYLNDDKLVEVWEAIQN